MVRGNIRRSDDDPANTGWICPVCKKVNSPAVLECDHDVIAVTLPSFIIVQRDNPAIHAKATKRKKR